MSTKTLTVAVALDDYYLRKNRGALELFGQENRLVDREGLFEDGLVEKKIADCFGEEEEIKCVIAERLDKLSCHDGEVIRRFLEEDICRKE